jgi:hypothetical protein
MNGAFGMQGLSLDADRIEQRKQCVRDLWSGRALDHVPVYMTMQNPWPRSTLREQLLDADKQWEEALAVLALTWKEVPENDLVPAVRPDVGCSCLATSFGAKLFWGDDENQTCGVRQPVLTRIDDAFDLEVPRPDAGQLAEGIRRVGRFAEAGQGLISVSLLDMAGGLNVAADLLGVETLYSSMYEAPEALECLLGKIQELLLATVDLQIRAAGGQERITNTDFPEYWFPEGRKGHVSDDISANISPAFYERFSRPFHNLLFQRYGGGGLHNCGPNPCIEGYLSHDPAPRAIDLSWQYSRNDFPRIKQVLKKRALVYLGDFPADPEKAIEAYRAIMELMTPDVIVIPHLSMPPGCQPGEIFRRMKVIATEYARRMDWGWQ